MEGICRSSRKGAAAAKDVYKRQDYIVQGNTEGTVKEIGLVYTELITADNRLIVIPNGTLIDSSICLLYTSRCV